MDSKHRLNIELYSVRAIFRLVALLLAGVSCYASGLIPEVSVQGAVLNHYPTPQLACQASLAAGIHTGNPPPVEVPTGEIFIRSWGGAIGWNDGALPYNTPGLGGWLCYAVTIFTSPADGHKETWYEQQQWMYPVCPSSLPQGPYNWLVGYYPIGSGNLYCGPVSQYYASAKVTSKADNGACCTDPGKALFADPINPATGNITSVEPDLTSSSSNELVFHRYYNSTDSTQNTLGTGWGGSFSRSIQANAKIASYQPLDPNAINSSLYNDEATACTSGFAQIKSQVANWAPATASFSNGVCLLSQGGTSLGALPIYAAYNYQTVPEASPPSFDIIRDDGQAIRFSVINGVITAPPSSRFTLQQTGSGYTLSDANDNVETYDLSGKLLTVTSRSGVMQTMSYDGSGRLSVVTDNFGHQLTLGYDALNRLNSVTYQK